jgi:hypothetical protein
MTDQFESNAEMDVDDEAHARVAWEPAEIAAVAVLSMFSVLVLGGLATGIAADTAGPQPPGIHLAAEAAASGADWASPVLAAILFGVLGLCWWQFQGWSEVGHSPGASDEIDQSDEVFEAMGHLRRSQTFTVWAQVALVLTALGSVAGFVGGIVNQDIAGSSVLLWSRDFGAGGSMLGTLVLGGAGLLIGQRLRSQYKPAVDEPER